MILRCSLENYLRVVLRQLLQTGKYEVMAGTVNNSLLEQQLLQ